MQTYLRQQFHNGKDKDMYSKKLHKHELNFIINQYGYNTIYHSEE
jgi:hypothetical protein